MVDAAASARGRSNRSRGHQAERDFANWLITVGWPDARRSVATGWRTAARRLADEGDITGTPGITFQVKYYAGGLTDAQTAVFLAETANQAAATGGIPVLVERREQKKPANWFCHLTTGDLVPLLIAPWETVIPAAGRTPVRLLANDLVRLLHIQGFGVIQ